MPQKGKIKKVLSPISIVLVVLLVVMLPATTLMAGESPWPVSGANPLKDRRAAVSGPAAAPQVQWRFKTPTGTFSGDPVSGPDGTMYAGTTAGAVYALDRDSGRVKWATSPGYPVIGSPAAGSSVVYITYGKSDGSGTVFALSCLNAVDGTPLWSLRSPQYAGADLPITASPTVGSDGIYVPLLYGVWKVKLSGETAWLYRGLPYRHENHCSPAVANNLVLFVTSLGRTYALSTANGSAMWSYLLPNPPVSGSVEEITPAVSPDGSVVYCCLKNSSTVYAVYTRTWGLKWTFTASGATGPAAVGPDGTVYVCDLNGKLFAIDPASGSQRWSYETATGAPVTSPAVGNDGTIFIFRGPALYALDPGGNLKWEYNPGTGGTGCGSPVLCGNNTVLVWTCSPGEGELLAIGQDTTPPAVIEYKPENGTPEVPVDANLALTFSENVVAREGKKITIKKQSDDSTVEEIPATGPGVVIDNNSVSINPDSSLDCETRYYVLVEPGAFADLAGNDYAGITEKTAWNFTTVPPPVQETPPLVVVSTDPADGALDVPPDKTITMMFNKVVLASNTTGGIKLYRRDDPASVVSFTYHIEETILTIDPESNLEYGLTYTLFIPAGSLNDLDKKILSEDCSFSFTTGSAPGNGVPDKGTTDTSSGGGPADPYTGTENKAGVNDIAPSGGVDEPAGPESGTHGEISGGTDIYDSPSDVAVKDVETGTADLEPNGMNMKMKVPAEGSIFKDLGGHWAEKTVAELAEMGIVRGYPDGTFRPNNGITRVELTALLVRVLRLQYGPRQRNIPALTLDAMEAGLEKDPTGFTPAKSKNPAVEGNKAISRTELASLLTQVIEPEPGRVPPADIKFNDAARIPEWGVKPVGVTVARGVMGGYPDGTFRPWNPATRAEAASVMLRLLKALGR
ncbi:Ig-like domain-containing protein [Desulfofundulus sp.]|uniref:Ig-like domain-containing protein n=1 Tax=Desulfofundulus sp. TaxID=2282750 RepID=UPI003C76B666